MKASFAAAVLLLVTACSDDGAPRDELQLVENPTAASPASSPEQEDTPDGRLLDVDGDVTCVAVNQGTLAAAVTGDDGDTEVLFYRLAQPTKAPKRVDVDGPVERLTVSDDQFAATVPSENTVLYLTLGGVVGKTSIGGAPTSIAELDGTTLVGLRKAKAVAVLEHEQQTSRTSGELASADQVLVSSGGAAVVLDRLRSALFEVQTGEADIGLGLRAGQGATNAVTDAYNRVLVVDTREEYLLAFSLDPLVLRQRYPVPGGPYGIAYDPKQDLAWVTLTARNEVVAFDVAGGEPEEAARFSTVRQPNAVTTDPTTGTVVVASGDGEGIQVIEP
ncbi:hypothetical protein [Haloechinothrix salitolerans]|uniref:YncE family protein n=1 Tax=Haloechinothrix salitolerans TaxID=926830 RepID=A0ABW2C1H1_9PSEU